MGRGASVLLDTVWNVSKYGVFSGPCSVWMWENTNDKKLRISTLFTQRDRELVHGMGSYINFFHNSKKFCGILIKLFPSTPNFLRKILVSKWDTMNTSHSYIHDSIRKSPRIYWQLYFQDCRYDMLLKLSSMSPADNRK